MNRRLMGPTVRGHQQRIYDWPTGRDDRNTESTREGSMDALSDVLKVAHLTGGVFLHAEFFAPWCISARVSPEHCAPALSRAAHLIVYHYVVEGELLLRIEGEPGETVVLRAGEV